MAACGFGISGPLEIRAVNSVSKEVITVAVIDDPATRNCPLIAPTI
ncbi:MAG: hypothetical protein ACLPX9_21745 [Rhodomicrobium sp.]